MNPAHTTRWTHLGSYCDAVLDLVENRRRYLCGLFSTISKGIFMVIFAWFILQWDYSLIFELGPLWSNFERLAVWSLLGGVFPFVAVLLAWLMISIRVDHRLYVLTIVAALAATLALAHVDLTCSYRLHDQAPVYGCASSMSASISSAGREGDSVLTMWLLSGLELLCLLVALDGWSLSSWRVPINAPVEKVLWMRPIIGGVHVVTSLLLNRRRFDFGSSEATSGKQAVSFSVPNSNAKALHNQLSSGAGDALMTDGSGAGPSSFSSSCGGLSSSMPPPPSSPIHSKYPKHVGYSEPVILFVCAQLYGEDVEEMKKLLLSYQKLVSEANARLRNVSIEFHVVFDGITERTFFKAPVRALDAALEALDADPGQRRPLSDRAANVHTSYGWLGKIGRLFGSRFPLFIVSTANILLAKPHACVWA